jgi:four helix bundle protein
MFDFEKLDLYQVIREQNIRVFAYLRETKELDPYFVDQWKRSSLSILMNLAEGTGRMSDSDKRHYLTIARGSVFESVALLDLLKGLGDLPEQKYEEFYATYEQISKMLLGMFRSYNKSATRE